MSLLASLLKTALSEGASDIHLCAGTSPVFRINGKIIFAKSAPLTEEDIKTVIYSVLTEEKKIIFDKKRQVDFGFSLKSYSRVRGNAFYEKGRSAVVFRLINNKIPSFSTLGLPKKILDMGDFPNGLCLVCGMTGSGKSTLISSILDHINQTSRKSIITIEDPIEYLYENKKSIVVQRELSEDFLTWEEGLKGAFRQDPDICMVGELQTKETIEMALRLAATGHLVFATLHTNSAFESISRIVGSFGNEQKDFILNDISLVLRAVVALNLVPSKALGRVPAHEFMIVNSAIKSLIRENKIFQIYSAMQVGQSDSKMNTMNQCLAELVRQKKIELDVAVERSPNISELERLMA